MTHVQPNRYIAGNKFSATPRGTIRSYMKRISSFLHIFRPLVVASHTGRGGEAQKVTFKTHSTYRFFLSGAHSQNNGHLYINDQSHVNTAKVLLMSLLSNIALRFPFTSAYNVFFLTTDDNFRAGSLRGRLSLRLTFLIR